MQSGSVINQQPTGSKTRLPPIDEAPSGLEHLSHLDTVQIHQLKEFVKPCTCWKIKNRYVLKNANGDQLYSAFEDSDTCERVCCGPNRGFVMHIVDNFQKEVLTIKRKFICCGNCCGGCCSGCQQECTVETPTMGILGTIRQSPGCMTSNFNVMDASGRVCFEIDGPDCCVLMGCGDKEFKILAANSDETIGAVKKNCQGWFQEAFTRADRFTVNFPENLDVKLKGVLLGATFLIHFMRFEGHSKKILCLTTGPASVPAIPTPFS